MRAWRINGFAMLLLSDLEPKGAMSRRYGAWDENTGMSERALFVIDPDGTVFWSYLSPKEVRPGARRHPHGAGGAEDTRRGWSAMTARIYHARSSCCRSVRGITFADRRMRGHARRVRRLSMACSAVPRTRW